MRGAPVLLALLLAACGPTAAPEVPVVAAEGPLGASAGVVWWAGGPIPGDALPGDVAPVGPARVVVQPSGQRVAVDDLVLHHPDEPRRVEGPDGPLEVTVTAGFGADAPTRDVVLELGTGGCVLVEPVQRWVVDALDGTRATLQLADVVVTTRPCGGTQG